MAKKGRDAKPLAERYTIGATKNASTEYSKKVDLGDGSEHVVTFTAPAFAAVSVQGASDEQRNTIYGYIVDGFFRKVYAALRATNGPVMLPWKGKRVDALTLPRPVLAAFLTNASLKLAGAKDASKVKGADKVRKVMSAALAKELVTATDNDGVQVFAPVSVKK